MKKSFQKLFLIILTTSTNCLELTATNCSGPLEHLLYIHEQGFFRSAHKNILILIILTNVHTYIHDKIYITK